MIHRKPEGREPKIGLNWNRDSWTKLYLGLVLPIWLTRIHNYFEFDTGDLVRSRIIHLLHFRLRINKKWRVYLSICSIIRSAGKKQILYTEEQLCDKSLDAERIKGLETHAS
jgi:hypothetical protein